MSSLKHFNTNLQPNNENNYQTNVMLLETHFQRTGSQYNTEHKKFLELSKLLTSDL